ncbi:MAG: nucleotidyltransferase family protein [Candidatus Omnitrophota bacterium]
MILAGGYGTRLYPVVKDIPKALLEVCGKTLIDHVLEKFQGVAELDEACVVTNDKFADMLQGWADQKAGLPFSVRVINDGTRSPQERLGAIGDILFVFDQEQAPVDWLVAGSDNLFDAGVSDFIRRAKAQSAHASVGVYDIRDRKAASMYGVLDLAPDGKIVSLEEKPKDPRTSLISMCLYYFPQKMQVMIRQYVQETGATDTTGGFLQWLYQKSSVYGFKFDGKWYDIGSLESFEHAQKSYRN